MVTGYELDALEQGERVALSRQPRACDCQLGTFCHLHAPEPSDWPHIRVRAEISGTRIQANSPAD